MVICLPLGSTAQSGGMSAPVSCLQETLKRAAAALNIDGPSNQGPHPPPQPTPPHPQPPFDFDLLIWFVHNAWGKVIIDKPLNYEVHEFYYYEG